MGNKKILSEINKSVTFEKNDEFLENTALTDALENDKIEDDRNEHPMAVELTIERKVAKILQNLEKLSFNQRNKVCDKCPYYKEILKIAPKFKNVHIRHFSNNDPFTSTFMSDSGGKNDPNTGYIGKSMIFCICICLITLVTSLNMKGGSLSSNPFSRANFAKFWLGKVKKYDIAGERCVIESPSYFADLFRPPVVCEACAKITDIPKVSHLTRQQFETKYAYSLQPVVVTDAQKNWRAKETFTWDFFKGIYHEGSPVLEKAQRSCQFFPYKTEFKSLAQVFNMTPERAQLKDGSKPWYVGWSNCDPEAANILRRYYTQPYFLPTHSESSRTDWIFMGSPGYGAHMHIDHVGKPSWQAQIKGAKKWILQPPPECYITCPNLEVTLLPGETIVLDTNRWYHKTLVVGDEMSVVIGSEYD